MGVNGKTKREFPCFNKIYPTEKFVQFTDLAESVVSSGASLYHQDNVQITELIRSKFEQWIDLETEFVNQEMLIIHLKINAFQKSEEIITVLIKRRNQPVQS